MMEVNLDVVAKEKLGFALEPEQKMPFNRFSEKEMFLPCRKQALTKA